MKTELELLKPFQYTHEIEERLNTLKCLLNNIKKRSENMLPGHLRISRKGNTFEFYHITERGDTIGHYIPRSKNKLAAQLAQKDYNARLIKILETEIEALQNYLQQTDNCLAYQNMIKALSIPRQMLITPVTLQNDEYIKIWEAKDWDGRPFSNDTPELFTTKGERVRSKSEVLIADSLNRFSIPYRYEYPLKLKNGITVHPDFLCLNVRTRQEFYWEHFGMMDNPEYAENAIHKLQQYSENNLHPGINLILTMETISNPLNLKYIEQQIKNYLT